ncbi:MAG TPA: ATP-binding protein [Acidimicrobiales bacterium]|jgi:two-component system sensor histidine kinase SenX3|nr:ATP-binding protein [Acidimicrobiales bacterium]
MAALALIAAGIAVVLAAVLLSRDARRREQIRTLTRERDDAVAERDAAMLAGERMRRAVDSLGLGVLVFDGQGAVVYRNTAASLYTSGRRTEAMATASIEELTRGALAGASNRRTIEQYGPPQRSIVLSAWPLDGDDPSIGAVVLIDDVSERRRLEAVRRDFVANISHELKTPVGALSLLAETLLGEEDADVVGRLAERILAEALRVGRTIDDLLELSRIEIDETFEHEVVHVGDVVSEAVQRIRPGAEQHGILLEAPEVSRDVTTIGDRRQLVSALFNLLDNAAKYSEAGSSVEVTVATSDAEVEIAVRDHGIGIPTRDIDRIFERFYRVDRARSRETGGTGLGLAIVRHVAVNHDGDVRVESRQGEGSTFTLTLPRHQSADGPSSAPNPEPAVERLAHQ